MLSPFVADILLSVDPVSRLVCYLPTRSNVALVISYLVAVPRCSQHAYQLSWGPGFPMGRCILGVILGWLGSRVVSVLDSGAEGPGFKSQLRRCRVTVLGKLFTPIVPLFTKQQNW